MNSTSLSVRDRNLLISVCSGYVFVCPGREICLYYEHLVLCLSNRYVNHKVCVTDDFANNTLLAKPQEDHE